MAYTGVDNVAREIKKSYTGVDNVARKIKCGYTGVDNVARKCFTGAIPANELKIGDSVYMNVKGKAKEFIVVHQGLPSSYYNSSCNGTWLLMRDIYTSRVWGEDGVNSGGYAKSTIHTYLNDTFFNLLDDNVQNIVKSISIPYNYKSGGSFVSGNLACNVFLLSHKELFNSASGNQIAGDNGSILGFFNGASNSDRIAYLNGTATSWWTRTINSASGSGNYPYNVTTNGNAVNSTPPDRGVGIRPALIIPSDTLVDSDSNIITK